MSSERPTRADLRARRQERRRGRGFPKLSAEESGVEERLTGTAPSRRVSRKKFLAAAAVFVPLLIAQIREAASIDVYSASESGPTPREVPTPEDITKEMARFERTIKKINEPEVAVSEATPAGDSLRIAGVETEEPLIDRLEGKSTESQQQILKELAARYESITPVKGIYFANGSETFSELVKLCGCTEEELLSFNPEYKVWRDELRESMGDVNFEVVRKGQRVFIPKSPDCKIEPDVQVINVPVTPDTNVGKTIKDTKIGIDYLNGRLEFYGVSQRVPIIKFEDVYFYNEWENLYWGLAWPDKLGFFRNAVMGTHEELGYSWTDPNEHNLHDRDRALKVLLHERLHQVFPFSDSFSEQKNELQHQILDYVVSFVVLNAYPEYQGEVEEVSTNFRAWDLANQLTEKGENVEEIFLKYGLPGEDIGSLIELYDSHYGTGAFEEKFLNA